MNVFTGIHGYKILAATVLVLALTLGWVVAAHAASPFGAQYGTPTGSVSAIAGGENSASNSSSGGSENLLASGGSAANTAAAGASSGASAAVGVSSGTSAVTGLLPDTGGSLFVAALLGIALVGTGLLLLRRADSR